ncbi:MAG TPA: acyl-CoA dehydrogenase family protein, partial [Thermodesulfobacteriota bacterium]
MDFFLREDQRIFKDVFRRFAEAEIAPLVEEAEETETFPLRLFPQMGNLGYLCPRYAEKYGGAEIDKVSEVLLQEEISRVSQGIASSWSAHSHLGTFPVYHWGSEEQKQKYLLPAIRGEKIFAFGLTEPNAGSDVKAIETT